MGLAMAKIGVPEAIKVTGKSRAYLYKLMKAGGLSFTIGTDGHRLLDVAELLRVIGPFQSTVDSPHGQQKTLVDSAETGESFSMTAFAVLENELKAAQEKLERMEREHRRELDLQQRLLDSKDAHIQSLVKINDGLMQRLLEHKPVEAVPAPVPNPVEPEKPGPTPVLPPVQSALMKKLKAKDSKKTSGKDKSKKGK